MPTAKPRYDTDGAWKAPRFDEVAWRELNLKVTELLRPYYPGPNQDLDPSFGDPVAEWTAILLDEAHREVDRTLRSGLTLTNEEMRAEIEQTVRALEKAEWSLSNLSDDLDKMLGPHVDVLDCRDRIRELIPRLVELGPKIDVLPKATGRREVEHTAAKRMAFRVLQLLMADGIPASATANTDLDRASTAVEILKILGDELQLRRKHAAWKDIVIEVKPYLKEQQAARALRKRGASTT